MLRGRTFYDDLEISGWPNFLTSPFRVLGHKLSFLGQLRKTQLTPSSKQIFWSRIFLEFDI